MGTPRGFKTTPRRQRILELRRAGMAVKSIAAELETSTFTVSTELWRMRKQGIDVTPAVLPPRQTRGYTLTPARKEVLDLSNSGLSINMIAQRTGLAFGTVNSMLVRLRRAGYDTKPKVDARVTKHTESAALRAKILAYRDKGKSYAEAADELGISVAKLKRQCEYIYQKLGVSMAGAFVRDPSYTALAAIRESFPPYAAVLTNDGRLGWVAGYRDKGVVSVIFGIYGPVETHHHTEIKVLTEAEFKGEHLK